MRSKPSTRAIGSQPLRVLGLGLVTLLLLQPEATARAPEASWDNRCEECHGDYAEFAGKYLWIFDGQLQGQHHIDNLPLFLQNHYIPPHQVDAISKMLAAKANSPRRFATECGKCHGEAAEFVAKSIWVRGEEMTAMGVGMEAKEFLQTHRDLKPEDVEFYLKLFARLGD